MKAIAYRQSLPIDHADALIDIELPAHRAPAAICWSKCAPFRSIPSTPKSAATWRRPKAGQGDRLGCRRRGARRPDVTLFKPGDEVWYAGDLTRAGTNSELHLVDERIVGHKPKNIDFAQAAALPLTTITAWELLFDRLEVSRDLAPDGSSRCW
jgi:hypothetical protein